MKIRNFYKMVMLTAIIAMTNSALAKNPVPNCPSLSVIQKLTFTHAMNGGHHLWLLSGNDFSYNNLSWNVVFGVRLASDVETPEVALAKGKEILQNALFNEETESSNSDYTKTICEYKNSTETYKIVAFNPPVHSVSK